MPSNLFKLDPEDYEIQPDELLVIALHSPGLPFYRLAHSLNQNLRWNLANIKEPYQPPEHATTPLYLNVLTHVVEEIRVQFFLVENLYRQQFWIPKMSDVSYWLVVTGPGLQESHVDLNMDLDKFLERLSEIVISAAILPFDSLSGSGRTSSLFKYFRSFYNFLDSLELIQSFE